MPALAQLPLPPQYDPSHALSWNYHPDQLALMKQAAEWRHIHGIQPSGLDPFRLHLLLIDCQKDFCLPEGSLYVGGRSGAGAVDDSARIADFIYRHLGIITTITATKDTHFAYQIFFPAFWIDRSGQTLRSLE